MSDTRFSSLKTDPRFRRPKKYHSKVVLDDRFKHLLQNDDKSKRNRKHTGRVDKYGRTVPETRERDDLRRFYRFDAEEDTTAASTIVDYARGAVLMASSDEEEEGGAQSDSDQDGFVSLGPEPNTLDEDDLEVDLDENTVAALDAQVAEYAEAVPERADVQQTKRLAVVNLDWDHVRAVHLFKIFSSLVSPTAPPASASTSHIQTWTKNSAVNVARGNILSVRVYPSEFGKKRMAKEEKEGPPVEVFRKKNGKVDEEINEKTIFETGIEADYDEDALRKYQLERLRYYYAIVECDTVEAAAHVFDELDGTELERSANVFDLSFVPDDMVFDDEPRDETSQLSDAPYRAVEFVTDALRHSKVKLTWDEEDPERHHILRRPLTKKEIDEADFRTYIASSSSSEVDSEDGGDESGSKKAKSSVKSSKKAERDKLRKLLLGGNDELPEGWGDAFDNKTSRRPKRESGEGKDVDMEVTFTPGLSETKNPEDENTLESYQRKMKEKRKKRKEARKQGEADGDGDGKTTNTTESALDDEFFSVESDGLQEEAKAPHKLKKKPTKSTQPMETSRAELALLAASDNPDGGPAHFDMKAVLKAEKQSKKKSKRKFKKRSPENDGDDDRGETQDDFVIDVRDERFAAMHEDHQFAIDPTNPQFKKTKSMAALLTERAKHQKSHSRSDHPAKSQSRSQQDGRSLQSLVESVKRKSATVNDGGFGKRRKLGKS